MEGGYQAPPPRLITLDPVCCWAVVVHALDVSMIRYETASKFCEVGQCRELKAFKVNLVVKSGRWKKTTRRGRRRSRVGAASLKRGHFLDV